MILFQCSSIEDDDDIFGGLFEGKISVRFSYFNKIHNRAIHKIDEDESEEDTDDDGDYGLIDPEAGFDETSAKKKPSRDATVTNGTELTAADTSLNGTKVETTTKKKDDDDDEVSVPTQL